MPRGLNERCPLNFSMKSPPPTLPLKLGDRQSKRCSLAAAQATMNVMVANLEKIERRDKREIRIRSEALDMLLFNLLQELIFFKDAEQLLLLIEQVRSDTTTGFTSWKRSVAVN